MGTLSRHTLARQIQTKPSETNTKTKIRIMKIQKSELYLLLTCTAQGGFRSFETTLEQSLFWILWLITGVEFNENFQKNDHRKKRNLPTKINFVFKQCICQWQRKLKVRWPPQSPKICVCVTIYQPVWQNCQIIVCRCLWCDVSFNMVSIWPPNWDQFISILQRRGLQS